MNKVSITLLLVLAVIIIGCSVNVETEIMVIQADSYRGEFVGGDPQRRSYTFTGLTGEHKELLTVDSSQQLDLRLDLIFGQLNIIVICPAGNEVFSSEITAGTNDFHIIAEHMQSGTYTLILDGDRADGQVKLYFTN